MYLHLFVLTFGLLWHPVLLVQNALQKLQSRDSGVRPSYLTLTAALDSLEVTGTILVTVWTSYGMGEQETKGEGCAKRPYLCTSNIERGQIRKLCTS